MTTLLNFFFVIRNRITLALKKDFNLYYYISALLYIGSHNLTPHEEETSGQRAPSPQGSSLDGISLGDGSSGFGSCPPRHHPCALQPVSTSLLCGASELHPALDPVPTSPQLVEPLSQRGRAGFLPADPSDGVRN